MLSKFDTVIMLFVLLIIASAAEYFKIPLNQYVFGAILLALNANGKNGNGATNGGNPNGASPVVGPDAPKA